MLSEEDYNDYLKNNSEIIIPKKKWEIHMNIKYLTEYGELNIGSHSIKIDS